MLEDMYNEINGNGIQFFLPALRTPHSIHMCASTQIQSNVDRKFTPFVIVPIPKACNWRMSLERWRWMAKVWWERGKLRTQNHKLNTMRFRARDSSKTQLLTLQLFESKERIHYINCPNFLYHKIVVVVEKRQNFVLVFLWFLTLQNINERSERKRIRNFCKTTW